MLERLEIKNLGLVDALSLDFTEGLTVFTGETGAGKSLLLSSVLLLSGARADAALIKKGRDAAHIYSEWNVKKNARALLWLEKHGMEAEEGIVGIRRIIKRKGRGQCFIQGSSVTAQELAVFYETLCEIHAQHEHQALFRTSQQTRIFDSYAKLDLEKYAKLTAGLKADIQKFKNADTEKEALTRELDYLHYAVKEIEDARIQDNEDETLLEEINTISHAEEIKMLWNRFFQGIEQEGSALFLLEQGKSTLQSLSSLQKELEPLSERYESVLLEIRDIVDSLGGYKDGLEDIASDALATLEQRLSLIEGLKKKYGKSIAQVQEFYHKTLQRIEDIEAHSHDEKALAERIVTNFKELFALSTTIRKHRSAAAQKFEQGINAILHKLAMPYAEFEVRQSTTPLFAQCSKISETMSNEALLELALKEPIVMLAPIEFFIRANRGEEAGKLSKIASGGELSRIMLAITIVGKTPNTEETLVLDEVDAGIGGKTGLSLAAYLQDIAKLQQILCVTHLSTVAAAAKQQILVQKVETDQGATIKLERLRAAMRKKELARMLVGNEEDELALQQAEKLLQNSRN